MFSALVLLFFGLSVEPPPSPVRCSCDQSDLVTVLYDETEPREHAALQTALCQASGHPTCLCTCTVPPPVNPLFLTIFRDGCG